MSFTVAEFICPVHGRFEALVERPVPDLYPCTVEDDIGELCFEICPWTISAPLGRVKVGEVSQGKVTKSERETWLDTEPLASGMSVTEWKSRRAKMWADRDRSKRKQAGLDESSFRAAERYAQERGNLK